MPIEPHDPLCTRENLEISRNLATSTSEALDNSAQAK